MQIAVALGAYERIGVIRDWMMQREMPGIRWQILPANRSGMRTYTTAEAKAFILGVKATLHALAVE